MSVFFVKTDKTSKMNPVVELVTVEGVKMNISDVYDRIEAVVDRELDKFDNTYFEVYDDEITSKGWIVIGNGALEDELQVLKTVNDTIDKIKGVEIVIDKMPSIPLGIYNYEFEIDIRGVITPQKTFKGDNMEIKVFNEKELEQMTDEQYDNLGCIYETTTEEEKDTMYNNQSEVVMALINTFKVDLRSTDAYKKLIKEIMNRKAPIDTNTFYDVLYNELFEWDCPMIDLGKNIQIECVTEDASFDYDYGSISSVHHCSIVIGYNIKIEDID